MSLFLFVKHKLSHSFHFFSAKEIFSYFIASALWFEIISPYFQSAYTRDIVDIYFYALGFSLYGIIQKIIQVKYEKDDNYLLW